MNGLNNCADDVVECPLCMEPLEVDDLSFYPCTCGYQICRFCWHRIRTDENELCPACRKEYPENPADFTPLTQEEMIAFKSQKRQRDQQRKQKITENRKHLANVRVVQKNLVFVVGLPPRLADADILKKHEYFGKYGKIHKVVINPSTTYAGVQGPSASAYVTYVHNCDALRAIQSVNNINIDGRLIKTSLGTTKYCSHFMKNQPCPKNDCMYLHELGDPEASFTKEEMHQGKHQEYEKRLHEALIATAGVTNSSGIGQINVTQLTSTLNGGLTNAIHNLKNVETSKVMNVNSTSSAMSSSSSSGSSSSSTLGTNSNLTTAISSGGQKEAWPSLLGSSANNKDIINSNGKTKKDKLKNERTKSEKNSKTKNKNNHSNPCNKNNSCLNLNNNSAKEPILNDGNQKASSEFSGKIKIEKIKDKTHERNTASHQHNKEQSLRELSSLTVDEEIKLISDADEEGHLHDDKRNINKHQISLEESVSKSKDRDTDKNECGQRSNSSSSNDSMSSNASCDTTSSLSGSLSGKSSPETESSINEKLNENSKSENHSTVNLDRSINNFISDNNCTEKTNLNISSNGKNIDVEIADTLNNSAINTNIVETIAAKDFKNITNCNNSSGILLDTSAALSKLNLFDDNNSFFSSAAAASYQQSLFLKNKQGLSDLRQTQLNNVISSHLPDLLNDWEEAFKNVIMRTNKQMEEQLHKQHFQQQQHQQQQQQQLHLQQQQEEYLRIQELQKRNNLLNNMGVSQINGPHNDFSNIPNTYHSGNTDLSRIAQGSLLHQQQHQIIQQQSQQTPQQSTDHLLESTHFGPNMSKFFDFHKNQQQQQQQQIQHQYLMNAPNGNNANGINPMNDNLRMASFLESNRMNSQFLDQSSIIPSQLLQKQRLIGKLDPPMPQVHIQHSSQKQQQQQQNRIVSQFSQNISVEDDLGFDPFIETQKGLAELMENEVVQQQSSNNTNNGNSTTSMASKLLQQQQHQQQQQQQQQILENIQRARMPPPGFNHMNSFNFSGASRVQNASKIMPFMNIPHSGIATNNSQFTPQQQLQVTNAWNPQNNAYQQQQQHQQQQQQHQQALNEQQMHQMQNQHQHTGNHKGYSNNDWTAMDPAILSLRQFSTFNQQPTMPHHTPPQDLFIQHLPQQQQQQQNNQGFVPQQSLHSNVNLPNGLHGVQQTPQAQVNANVQGMLEYLKTRQFV